MQWKRLQISRFFLVPSDRAPYIAWVLSQKSRKATPGLKPKLSPDVTPKATRSRPSIGTVRGSIPAASTSIRSDWPSFDEVRRPGWRDARDFESLRRQQVAPLLLGSLLAPDEDEHV